MTKEIEKMKIMILNDMDAGVTLLDGKTGFLKENTEVVLTILPYHLKCGVMKWNQSSISFDNNSKIETEAFSPTAGLGKTINFLILDEFAWCPPNEVELFYNNIIPTISADTSANICIMSTQNGFNLFYKLYTAAVKEENIYAPFKVDWWQVPMWDKTLKAWIKRDETWKKTMIGVLGSEEAFFYLNIGVDAIHAGRFQKHRFHKVGIAIKSRNADSAIAKHKVIVIRTIPYIKQHHRVGLIVNTNGTSVRGV
jgi:hypothetical protein